MAPSAFDRAMELARLKKSAAADAAQDARTAEEEARKLGILTNSTPIMALPIQMMLATTATALRTEAMTRHEELLSHLNLPVATTGATFSGEEFDHWRRELPRGQHDNIRHALDEWEAYFQSDLYMGGATTASPTTYTAIETALKKYDQDAALAKKLKLVGQNHPIDTNLVTAAYQQMVDKKYIEASDTLPDVDTMVSVIRNFREDCIKEMGRRTEEAHLHLMDLKLGPEPVAVVGQRPPKDERVSAAEVLDQYRARAMLSQALFDYATMDMKLPTGLMGGGKGITVAVAEKDVKGVIDNAVEETIRILTKPTQGEAVAADGEAEGAAAAKKWKRDEPRDPAATERLVKSIRADGAKIKEQIGKNLLSMAEGRGINSEGRYTGLISAAQGWTANPPANLVQQGTGTAVALTQGTGEVVKR